MNTLVGVDNEIKGNDIIHFEKVKCPRCGSFKSTIIFTGKDFLYKVPGFFHASECENCGLWFQNPRPISNHIDKLYSGDYIPHVAANKYITESPIPPSKRKYLRENYEYVHLLNESSDPFDWKILPIFNFLKSYTFNVGLIPNYVPNGKLLEIGCGSGGRLIELRKLGWQFLHGVELIPEAAEKAKANGFTIECGQIEDVIANYADDYFDVIITSMVVEHFLNPFEVFESITRKLKPGGQLLFSTVVRDSIDCKLYKEYWAGFDFPRHMVYFKKKDLLNALTNNYESVKWFHQNAPIDFKRSSTWKLESNKGNVFDRIIAKTSGSFFAQVIGQFLAWMQLTTRVSCKCVKKMV